MIARVCWLYHYTPSEAYDLTLGELDVLLKVAEEADSG